MTNPAWAGLAKSADILKNSVTYDALEKVDRILVATMEAIAHELPTATSASLKEGALLAKGALETLDRAAAVDEGSPSYVAGRLAAAADVLGYASYQTADDAIVALARRHPYSVFMAALNERAMRNVELAAHLKKDEAQVSRCLRDLRAGGAVTSHKRGRDVFNTLTPIGRLIVEQGIVEAARQPIEASNIYDLKARQAPQPDRSTALPRLNASVR